jgi:hypothetical protein
MRTIAPVENRPPSQLRALPPGTLVPDVSRRPESSFSEVMRRVATQVDRGEAVVNHALRASPYTDDPKGMIALQAGVYRYVEAVDLVTRVVDRATTAVKTTLQNQ